MTLYFECRINKNALFFFFFGDFAHWEALESTVYVLFIPIFLSFYFRNGDTRKAQEEL